MSIVGGQHKPYRETCEGSVLCGLGSPFRHGKISQKSIPEYINNTMVNGKVPAPLPQKFTCGFDLDPKCDEQYNWKTNSSGTCGPWPVDGDVPPNTFTRGIQISKAEVVNGASGYKVGDLLNVAGGTLAIGNSAAQIRVDEVNGSGQINKAHIVPSTLLVGNYSASPQSMNSPTGGSGSGTVFRLEFTDAVADFSKPCQRIGFKNVQARRQWHGKFGFTTHENGAGWDFMGPQHASPYCQFGRAEYLQPNPEQVKYLTQTCSFYEIWANDYDTAITSASFSISVNALSGTKTLNSIYAFPDYAAGELQASNMPYYIWVANIVNQPYIGDTPTLSCAGNSWTMINMFVEGVGIKVVAGFSITPSGFSGSQTWYQGNDTVGWRQTNYISLNISATSISYNESSTSNLCGYAMHNKTVSVNLSGENTGASVRADAENNLLSTWTLNDDVLYPWRTDGSEGVAPLVTRDEAGFNIEPTLGDTIIVGVQGKSYSGAILGAPKPGGYGKTFDFRRENLIDCPPAENETPSPSDTDSYGAWTPDYLPQNCTQWTPDNLPLRGLPPGAGIYYKYSFNNGNYFETHDYLEVSKWAEALYPWKSQNFARPAGADKFLFDETTASGADKVWQVKSGYSNGTGDTIVLADYFGDILTAGMLSVNSGDVWGGQSVGGFYNISKISDSTVLLGAKIYNVPANWAALYWPSPMSGEDAAVAFGRLRFPDCPGILGRVAISAITDEALCHLTVDASPYLAVKLTASPPLSELVDLCSVDMTVLASNVPVTRISDTDFTVTTAYATIKDAKWIVPHVLADGATPGTHYWWNDNNSKRDYLYTDFTFNYRAFLEARRVNGEIAACLAINQRPDPSAHPPYSSLMHYDCSVLGGVVVEPPSVYSDFTQIEDCIPFDPCNPSVVCISPNGEVFPNGATYDFPTGIQLDQRYGTQWQAVPTQVSADLLWQKPHHPPLSYNEYLDDYSDYAWVEDDGNCKEDETNEYGGATKKYYPHAPMVEARNSLPTNGGLLQNETAPALPEGVIIGFLSPADNTGADVITAPGLGSAGAWRFYESACGCINNDGRFFEEYSNFMRFCNP